MHLTPHEQERLLVHVAEDVAQRRRERGLLLNYPEVMALLTAHVYEEARAGATVDAVMESGRHVLQRGEVMDGVPRRHLRQPRSGRATRTGPAPVDLVLIESGGDNLTATFSRGLVDVQVFVIDVASGDDIPREGGPRTPPRTSSWSTRPTWRRTAEPAWTP